MARTCIHMNDGGIRCEAIRLRRTIDEIVGTAKKGRKLLDDLSPTAKDEVYPIGKDIVDEVFEILLAALPDCAEVVQKLEEYNAFLADLEW